MTETPERAAMLNRCCAVNRNGYRCEVNTGERHEIHRAFVNEHDEQGKIPEFRWREVDGVISSASPLSEDERQSINSAWFTARRGVAVDEINALFAIIDRLSASAPSPE